MESIFSQVLQSNNIVAIVSFIVCYLVIYFQRKNTSEKRNANEKDLQQQINDANSKLIEYEAISKKKFEETQEELEEKISEFNVERQLMVKDINYLLAENSGIKEDIKEMKNTLQTMALALERIAAKYDKD